MSEELEWGQTPWDDLDRETLLREVQRMASALQSANSVLRMVKYSAEEHPYWSIGTGARACKKIDQALARLEDYDSETVYRSFYRYADDLLFTGVGFGWAVCPVCSQMIGKSSEGADPVGTKCADHLNKTCPGVLRPIEWDDLKPASS